MENFIKHLKEKDLSSSTIDSYGYTIKEFFNKYSKISADNLKTYKEFLLKNKSPKTVAIRIIAINQYLKFIKSDLELKKIKLPKKHYVDNVISKYNYNKLINFLDYKFKEEQQNFTLSRLYVIIKVLATTGIRISEIWSLNLTSFENGYQDIVSKGCKARRVYIPKSTCQLVFEWYKFNNKQLDPDNLFNITSRGITNAMQQLGDKLCIDKCVLHPHSFRHFFAKEFLKKNNDISLLADILGHSSVATTQIYTRKSIEEQQQEFFKAVDW